MFHTGHYANYAVDPGGKGERFRNLWDNQKNTSTKNNNLLRSFPLALLCQHNTGVNGTSKAGCGSCKTYGCSIKGTVKISECANCDKWEKLQPAEHQDKLLPPLVKRAANYIASLAEHTANGQKTVPPEVRESRWKICEPCEHRNREHNACSLCGCSLKAGGLLGDKLDWAVSSCPVKKWDKWDAEQVNQWPALIANAFQDCSDKEKAIYSELAKNANWPTVPASSGGNKISLKTVVLSFPMGRNCRYNKGVNGFVKSNHVKEKTFDCAVKGTIRISTCDKCQMWEARQPTRSTLVPQTQYNSESRHLLFHLWPKKTSAGTWQRNLDQLKQRWQLFTGKKVIAVATSIDTHSLEAVQDYMHGYDCEWVHVENDPALREVKTFYQLFDRVEGLPGYTFYAQGKGVSKPINRGVSIHSWTMAMYEILLDYWPLVEQNLKSKPVVGCFKKSAPGMFGGSQSTWHYSGSFAWFKNDELFSRNWRVIEQVWFGIESYPSMVFSDSEAACLFHCHNKQFNLYSLGYWKKVERELEQWRSEAAKYRSAGGLLMTSWHH